MDAPEIYQGHEIVRQEQNSKKKLAHEKGEGAPCLKCGPACEGLDLHFWRKICRLCHCKYEDHDVKDEDEMHHDIVLNLLKNRRPCTENANKPQVDLKSEPVIGEDVKANFIQVPECSSSAAMAKYLDSVPEDKAGHKGEAGQQYRSQQLSNQLPVHDFDDSYCDKLSDQERELMRAFNDKRDAEAAGQGNIKEKTEKELSSWVCEKCNENLYSGEVAVFAERAGKDKCWHPKCFVCDTCTELLVDLIYFFKDGKIHCGRHYGELTRVRCAACDELIFTKEYTQADGRDWHIKHFCCINCDTALAGKKYVSKEEKPYCMDCYDQLFAKCCQFCKIKIAADGKRVNYKDKHWHATDECFGCVNESCKKTMLGQQFIYKDGNVFCSPPCARKHLNK